MIKSPHYFHIPVMGTAFTIDTPYKVARFGISSVVSIGDDELCETMREFYCKEHQLPYTLIAKETDVDYRANRITAYLDLLHDLIEAQISAMKESDFIPGSDLSKYFELLHDNHPLKAQYHQMQTATGSEKQRLIALCKDAITPGAIDVNIMTKIDRTNIDANKQPLPDKYSDAVSALRGFSNSKLNASIVFSAGFNRRLFAHCEEVEDFYLNDGAFKKRIILKVSDYRSSLIQGRFLAKKGIWVSEYRIESGLNCGGHAFATDGLLCGPILEEFKTKGTELEVECRSLCNEVLAKKDRPLLPSSLAVNVTYQGGIGTYQEQQFLMDYYKVTTTGWATPFLLVPEVTSLDMATRQVLVNATKADCYLSGESPLGVPFNTVKNTSSEAQKQERIANGRPGSPCPKGHLVSDMEFSKKPVCKASVFYQKRKIEQLKALDLVSDEYDAQFAEIVEKSCLCEDLAAPALIEKGIENKRPLASTVCAGPNIAYYKRIVTLKEMVDHIYGRLNLIEHEERPSFFVAELNMYIKYLAKELSKLKDNVTKMEIKRYTAFADNIMNGISYYITLTKESYISTDSYKDQMLDHFESARRELKQLMNSYQSVFFSKVLQLA